MPITAMVLEAEQLYVVHPLDDAPEEKCNPDDLTHMVITPSVRASLILLRSYLIVIIGLALFHLGDLFIKGLYHTH